MATPVQHGELALEARLDGDLWILGRGTIVVSSRNLVTALAKLFSQADVEPNANLHEMATDIIEQLLIEAQQDVDELRARK
jgi:hypothetical protein